MIEINRTGITRTVFIFKNYVIKIPCMFKFKNFLHGLLANIREWEFRKYHPALAKTIYSNMFGLLNIMEYCSPIEMSHEEFEDYIYKTYKDNEYYNFLMRDSKKENWGVDPLGNIVKIDYGS